MQTVNECNVEILQIVKLKYTRKYLDNYYRIIHIGKGFINSESVINKFVRSNLCEY